MTPLQQAVYDFVRDQLTEIGEAPTIREICERFLMPSPAQAHDVVDALVRMGRLRRTAARVRNLALPEAELPDVTIIATGVLQAELERRGRPMRRPERIQIGRDTRPCGAPLCAARVERGNLLCRDHWFRLPKALRYELIETGRKHQERNFAAAWQRAIDHLESLR